MVNPGGVGGGGGPIRPRLPQEGTPRTESKDTKGTKESKDSKEAKGAEGKAGAGGAGGVKGKAKAKGKDLGSVGVLLGGGDQFAVEDEGDKRRRRGKAFFDEEENFEETPWEEDGAFAVSNINAEFRAQVAGGLAQARSWTRGGQSSRDAVEETASDDEGGDQEEYQATDEVTVPRARVKKAGA
jgi:hypothetical protein